MKISVADFIVKFLEINNIKDTFGYPGGMISELMYSLSKSKKINTHLVYNEQGASMAACGYSQSKNSISVCFATSGPGATNLLTGIANAYFDSVPMIVITGQVNTFESSLNTNIRQIGFQEANVLESFKPMCKKSVYVYDATKIEKILYDAFIEANTNRKGPIHLDIPLNIFKQTIEVDKIEKIKLNTKHIDCKKDVSKVLKHLKASKRPVIIIGQGIKNNKYFNKFIQYIDKLDIPVVSTMALNDVVKKFKNSFNFIGAYGNRKANFIVAKSDLVISLGARLNVRQVGGKRHDFASEAKIIRVDIDLNELKYKLHDDDININKDLNDFIFELLKCKVIYKNLNWLNVCNTIKNKLNDIDITYPNTIVETISNYIDDNTSIVNDVGQNQIWVCQSFKFKDNQKMYNSLGFGAMGYSLPASIGIALATKNKVISFNGDGGIQMNIQELQTVKNLNLPITIIVFNNNALGMIRQFQEVYYGEKSYFKTTKKTGFINPDFTKLGKAYGIETVKVRKLSQINHSLFNSNKPKLIEIVIDENTYIKPKLKFKNPNQDMEPQIDRDLYKYLMEL